MTEAEWLAATDPGQLLNFIRAQVSQRKIRLYGCGRCRLFGGLSSLAGIDVAERYADGQAAEEERQAAFAEAVRRMGDALRDRDQGRAVREADVRDCNRPADYFPIGLARYGNGVPSEEEACRLVHEVFGNPFRSVTFDPAWRTSTVLALATQIYGSRDFSTVPILADALQDAGCDSAEVLDHCRGPGPHVRGCWVVDLVLNQK